MTLTKQALPAYLLSTTILLGSCSNSDDGASTNNKSGDTVAPLFSGNATATAIGATKLQLKWDAAFDEVTPESELRYQIYDDNKSVATVPGRTQITLTGLALGSHHPIVIYAMDSAGNRTKNKNDIHINTGDKAIFGLDIQPVLNSSCAQGACHNNPNDANTHNMDFRFIESAFTSLMGVDGMGKTMEHCSSTDTTTKRVVAGDLASSMLLTFVDPTLVSCDTAGGVKMPPIPSKPLSASFINILNNWIVTSMATADVVAPSFAGVATVEKVSGSATQLSVTWAAATDLVTPASEITYEIVVYPYPSDFQTRLGFSVKNQTEYIVTGLAPASTYEILVTAVDGEGNWSAGGTHQPATTDSIVSFAKDIQPTLQSAECGMSCHNANTQEPAMDLVTDTYNALVNAEMEYCPPGLRIQPGNVENSLLLSALDWGKKPCVAHLSRMPENGLKPSRNYLDAMESWILAGAPNN